MSRAAAATPIQSGYMWKEGEFLSKWCELVFFQSLAVAASRHRQLTLNLQ
jgi:hypothetical protein